MISFRPCVMHITNSHNNIYLLHKIDIKTFSKGSCSSFKNSLVNINQFKRQLIHSTGIVDNAIPNLRSDLSKQILIINKINKNSIYEKQCKFISTHKSLCNKVINKQSHFGTNLLFIKNDFTTRNCYNVRQMSSFYERTCDSLYKNYVNLITGISESAPVEFAQNSLIDIHSYTGLPWWATIVLTTILLRLTISLPIAIYQQNVTAKLENLRHEMTGITTNLERKIKDDMFRNNWSQEHARRMYILSVRKKWKDLIVRDNCHPVKTIILAYIEIPILIILTFSLRNLCYMLPKGDMYAYENYLEFTTGGFGWITNLAVADSYFILPILTALINLANVETFRMLRLKEPTILYKCLTNFLRLVSVVIIPLSPFIPSSLCLYWITNSACTLGQKVLLLSPKFRRLTRIPETESELSHPYSFLYKKIKGKTNLEALSMKKLK
ncbi:PREDICTED: mitochondrial inner membrane protein COX18 [Polistes dominula]|uniref:Mitochondrial inner membrane protein COX18 n=1 Tax=Polistes dominula TaxID=743375 RepID=A0ABM1JGP1_POLDO|nr:PREDICTED: mitochondrial inner membrane protein COX18 [Polistes dominula]